MAEAGIPDELNPSRFDDADCAEELEALAARFRKERDALVVLIENSDAQLVYLDRDFRFRIVNSAYANSAGVAKEDLIGRDHFELFPNAENEAIFRRVRDTGEPVTYYAKPFVYEHQPWRGVTYWDWTLRPVKADDGYVYGLVFSLVDVTTMVRRQQLSDTLSALEPLIHSSLDVDTIFQRITTGAVTATGCEAASIAARVEGGWRITHSYRTPEDVWADRVLPPEVMPVAEEAATRREVVVINDVSRDLTVGPVLEPFGIKSILDVPLFVRDEVVGVLALMYYSGPGEFTPDVVEFAQRFGASASLALSNARLYEEEHRVAETIRRVLARPMPDVPSLDIGIVYRPAWQAERVGGDFYDVFELDDGRVVVLIGDVSGKGVRAAALTETVRSSVRALAYLDASPAVVLTRLNQALLRQVEEDAFVTAVLAVIEPVSGDVLVSSAGHPAPVFCSGKSMLVDMPPGVILGAFDVSYSEVGFKMGEGTLLLYTDGVTEVRRHELLFGHGRLLRLTDHCDTQDPQELADHVLDGIMEFGNGMLPDDVAIVAIRRTELSRRD